jgi:hypothetical protein
MAVLRVCVIGFWLATALYVGFAGIFVCNALEKTSESISNQYVEYKGISFENEESLQEFLHDSEGANLFPWIFALPEEFAPLITSVAFGLLGGVVLLLKRIAIDRSPISSLPTTAIPAFGAFVGFMLFLLSFLLPALFVAGRNPARTITLVGLSFFGGGFSEQAYLWVSEQVVGKLFPTRKGRHSKPTRESVE